MIRRFLFVPHFTKRGSLVDPIHREGTLIGLVSLDNRWGSRQGIVERETLTLLSRRRVHGRRLTGFSGPSRNKSRLFRSWIAAALRPRRARARTAFRETRINSLPNYTFLALQLWIQLFGPVSNSKILKRSEKSDWNRILKKFRAQVLYTKDCKLLLTVNMRQYLPMRIIILRKNRVCIHFFWKSSFE